MDHRGACGRGPDYELTSIVILTHNQLPSTRLCIDSIRLLTDELYELVFNTENDNRSFEINHRYKECNAYGSAQSR